jgi:type I restriction enzyme S subunit
VPPKGLQTDFSSLIGEIDRLKISYRDHMAKLDVLFASLQHRAFCSELTSASKADAAAELALVS